MRNGILAPDVSIQLLRGMLAEICGVNGNGNLYVIPEPINLTLRGAPNLSQQIDDLIGMVLCDGPDFVCVRPDRFTVLPLTENTSLNRRPKRPRHGKARTDTP